jgi:hypothetical protein
MGKKHKGAKNILKQIEEVDQQIAESMTDMIMLKAEKGKILAKMCLAEGDDMPHGAPGGSQKPQRTTTLGDILSDEQIQGVVDILNRPNLDDIAVAKLLKQYLGNPKWADGFDVIGMVPEFVAYVIVANKDALRRMGRQSNRPDEPYTPRHTNN